MATLNEQIQQIQTARDNMKLALEGKGMSPSKDIRTYAEEINNLSGVKLFETVAEMQQDSNAQEGDLAVVYREEIQPINENSEFDSCIFPNEVVLDEAFSDSISGSFRNTGSGYFNGYVNISSSSFRFDGYGGTMIRVQYTSNDGITYTRTDGGEELQEFGATIKWNNGMGSFNSVIGNFMKTGGKYFDGLYEYKPYTDINYVVFPNINNMIPSYEDNTFSLIWNGEYGNIVNEYLKIINILTKMVNDGVFTQNAGQCKLYVKNNTLHIIDIPTYQTTSMVYNIGTNPISFYGLQVNLVDGTARLKDYVVDLDTQTYTLNATIAPTYTTASPIAIFPLSSDTLVLNGNVRSINDISISVAASTYIYINMENTSIYGSYNTYPNYPQSLYWIYNKYLFASSQLTATNDLVYNSAFYGKNGAQTGTLGTSFSPIFDDGNATLYSLIKNQYNTMSPSVITDKSELQGSNIVIVPKKDDGTLLIDISSASDIAGLFQNCKQLIEVQGLDLDNKTDCSYLFNECNNLKIVKNLKNTSDITTLSNAFYNCKKLQSIELFDTSNVVSMQSTFSGCESLTSIPMFDTSSMNNAYSMFMNCKSLTTIPLLDFSNVTSTGGGTESLTYTFYQCTSLITVPLLDFSNAKYAKSTFYKCTSLTTVPAFNLQNAVNISNMFTECTSLISVPSMTTTSVTDMGGIFSGCTSLENIGIYDTSKVTGYGLFNIVSNCPNLSNTSLNNILQMCANSNISSSTKTLQKVGLSQAQAQTCTTLSNWSACQSAGWTTGY